MNTQMNMVHTTIRTQGNSTFMQYHSTDVARMDILKGTIRITLDNGGYYTKTTKKRMNQFAEIFGLYYRVLQSAGVWCVELPEQVLEFSDNGIISFELTR